MIFDDTWTRFDGRVVESVLYGNPLLTSWEWVTDLEPHPEEGVSFFDIHAEDFFQCEDA